VPPASSLLGRGVLPPLAKSSSDKFGEDGGRLLAVKGAGKRVQVADQDGAELERIVRAMSSEVRMVERARIVLCAAEGKTAEQISGELGCSLPTVVKWRGRFARQGIEEVQNWPNAHPRWSF